MNSSGLGSVVTLFGLPIQNVNREQAVDQVMALCKDHRGSYVTTPNVDHIVKLKSDTDFQEVYRHADLIYADGMPLVWTSRLCGKPLVERVSGADLFVSLCQRASLDGLTVFFLGAGQQSVVDTAAQALKTQFPDLRIVGAVSPSWGFEANLDECAKLVDQINHAAPDLLFVGVGAPKQEKWIYRYRRAMNVGVSLGVGASIDFVAGAQKRAPLWMQTIGLEWLFRLIQDPRRMIQRYLVDDLLFFRLAWHEIRRSKRQRQELKK